MGTNPTHGKTETSAARSGELVSRSRPSIPRPSGIRGAELMPDLTELKDEIAKAREDEVRSARQSLENAIRIGKLLNKVKKHVGHGRYNAWVSGNCTFSTRAAADYTRLADHESMLQSDLKTNPQNAADLSIRAALKRLGKPRRGSENCPDVPPRNSIPPGPVPNLAGTKCISTPVKTTLDPKPDAQTLSLDGVPGPQALDRFDDLEEATAPLDRGNVDAGRRREPADAAGCVPVPGAAEVSPLESWLATFSIRSQLAEPTRFDRAAILWQCAQSLPGDPIPGCERFSSSPMMRGKDGPTLKLGGILETLVLLKPLPPPREWRPCVYCLGGFVPDGESLEGCTGCGDAGFMVEIDRPRTKRNG